MLKAGSVRGSPELWPSMQIPSLALRAFIRLWGICEGLPMSREPALAASEGRMPEANVRRRGMGSPELWRRFHFRASRSRGSVTSWSPSPMRL